MVHGTDEWSETNAAKVKEKKTTPKNVRESKGAGSRRIFSPIFKLQVLDSYRKDADCQGNQRATARKYGIHRRQIQKWLQMETNLRLSVQQQQQQQRLSNDTSALNLSSCANGRPCDDNKESNLNSSNIVAATESKKSSSAFSNKVCGQICDKDDEERVLSDSEEYVNVDEITDSEEEEFDVETSSCSSYEKATADRALDFTTATLSKRKFYTSDFKLHVLDAFKNDKTCRGNQRATARKFGIHRRQVQKWLYREDLIKSKQSCGNACLDLSQHKRKLEPPEEEDDDAAEQRVVAKTTPPPKKKLLREEDVQESALCLVKSKIEPIIENNNYHRILYPSALEHSYNSCSSSPLSYITPADYPLYVYQPWHCCYQRLSTVGAHLDTVIPKYSYSFNFKYEASYVDIPVQYGFGDSVPSKWMKENPLYIPAEPPTIQVLSSYR